MRKVRRKFDVAAEQSDKQFQFLKMRQRNGTCREDAGYQRPMRQGQAANYQKRKTAQIFRMDVFQGYNIWKSSDYEKCLWTQRGEQEKPVKHGKNTHLVMQCVSGFHGCPIREAEGSRVGN